MKKELDLRESLYREQIRDYKEEIDNLYREKLLTLAKQKMKDYQKKMVYYYLFPQFKYRYPFCFK